MSLSTSKNAIDIANRILVVEEEPGLRMVLESELVRAGYHVEVATHGIEALGLLSKNRYDVALLDLTVPGKSGIELLQFILDHRLNTRVIMLTAIDGIPLAIKALKLGADDYIPKPFDAEYLLNAVKMVLKQRK